MKKAVIVHIIAFLFFPVTFSQEQIVRLTAGEKTEAIEKVGSLLQRFYVFPEVATQMVDHLDITLNAGVFDTIVHPQVFADVLTRELRSVCHDKHLAVFLGANPDLQPVVDDDIRRINARLNREARNYGIRKLEILPGNIGYMDIQSVMYSREAMEVLDASMKFLENTDAILFDLRTNRGGDPGYMAYLFSYFFEEPTHINSIYWRDRDRTDEFWTRESVPGKKRTEVPIYVLIGPDTFSGAEEFAYDLKSLKRATIVGEVSAGGANPASSWVVYRDLRISIPYGRAISPVTGTNWEGVGVIPDIATTADSAFSVAHRKASKEAAAYAEAKKSRLISASKDCSGKLEAAMELIQKGHVDDAEALVYTALDEAMGEGLYNEDQINSLGYEYLRREETLMAIALLRFNTLRFPMSANAFDSLGEAYLENGNKEHAIINYKKSLELDPGNNNASEMLKTLKRF